MYGKLKVQKERVKTKSSGQDVPYDIHCNVTAVINFDSVYKQGKNYHPQVHVKECEYTETESQ